VAHPQHPPSGLAANGEGFGQQVIQRLAVVQPAAELARSWPALGVGFGLQGGFHLADPGDEGPHRFDDAGVLVPKTFFAT